MLWIAADALSTVIRERSVLYAYSVCGFLPQSATIHSPILKVISCFTHAVDKVNPYWFHTLYTKFHPYSIRSDLPHPCIVVKGVLILWNCWLGNRKGIRCHVESLLEQVEEETDGKPFLPRLTCKAVVKMETAVCHRSITLPESSVLGRYVFPSCA